MEWKVVADFPDYAVSEYGYVKRIIPDSKGRISGKELKLGFDTDGYLKVNLFKNKKVHCRTIHKIVCLTFHGPKPSANHQVGHRDGNRTNNHFSNLRWVTALENAKDRDLHGNTSKGEKHPSKTKPGYLPTGDNHWARYDPGKVKRGKNHSQSKLDEKSVIEIRQSKMLGIDLAVKFGVTASCICAIKKHRTWRHLK